MSQDKLLSFLDDDTYAEFKAVNGDISKLSDKAYDVVKAASKVAADFETQIKVPKVERNKITSAVQGAASAASLGFDDEVGGFVNAAIDGVKGKGFDYARERDKIRDLKKELQEANPWSYGIGSVAGSLPSVLLPGAGALNSVKAATGIGALAGLGESEADTVGGALTDSALGGAIGGVAQKVIPGAVGKAKDAAGYIGKKIGNVGFGVGEEATERYLQNPDAIRSAAPLKETTDAFLSKLSDVGSELSRDSGKSYEFLSAINVKPEVITTPINSAAAELLNKGAIGGERKAALKFLSGISSDISAGANEAGELSLDKGKYTLAVLDGEIDKLKRAGGDSQILKAYVTARKGIDNTLKSKSPEYAGIMKELAEDTQKFKGIDDRFKSDGGAAKMMKRVSRGKDDYAKDALDTFDDRFDSNFSQELQDAGIANQFSRETTNGSRRTLAGAVLGGAIGSFVAPGVGSVVGQAVGAATGAAIDKVGGKVWQGILDGVIKVSPAYESVIRNAAKRGPEAARATHLFLLQKYPDYKKEVETQ